MDFFGHKPNHGGKFDFWEINKTTESTLSFVQLLSNGISLSTLTSRVGTEVQSFREEICEKSIRMKPKIVM